MFAAGAAVTTTLIKDTACSAFTFCYDSELILHWSCSTNIKNLYLFTRNWSWAKTGSSTQVGKTLLGNLRSDWRRLHIVASLTYNLWKRTYFCFVFSILLLRCNRCWPFWERHTQTGRQKASERSCDTQKSSHQNEFSTADALSEGARQLLPARRGHVQNQSAYLTHCQLSGHWQSRGHT